MVRFESASLPAVNTASDDCSVVANRGLPAIMKDTPEPLSVTGVVAVLTETMTSFLSGVLPNTNRKSKHSADRISNKAQGRAFCEKEIGRETVTTKGPPPQLRGDLATSDEMHRV
jgi:hypothetical protein